MTGRGLRGRLAEQPGCEVRVQVPDGVLPIRWFLTKVCGRLTRSRRPKKSFATRVDRDGGDANIRLPRSGLVGESRLERDGKKSRRRTL